MADRDLDVVLYGATGFTGRQAARHFAMHAPAGLKWAIAGRSRSKLEALQAEVRAPGGPVVADSSHPDSVDAMIARTRVALSTAGPFARYGGPVVDACVRHRADYVDITGEAPWVRGLIDRHHEKAAKDGTRIVPCCGFDSAPSDLGALLVATWIRDNWGLETRRVSASYRIRGGGLNGGTLASALDLAESVQPAPLLAPEEPGGSWAGDAEHAPLRYDEARRVWLGPFFLALMNARVVHRSAALMSAYGAPYGSRFEYEELLEHDTRLSAIAAAAGAALADHVFDSKLGRRLVRRLGPKPWQGPSEEAMRRGSTRARFVGEAVDGRKVLATIEADGDPGNRVTVSILSEAALALATQRDELPGAPDRGGILTPATGLGLVLLDRLKAVGFRIEIGPLAA